MADHITCPSCRGAGLLAPEDCERCGNTGIIPREGEPWPEMTAKMARVVCVYCNTVGKIEAVWRLEAKAPGTHSLSGNNVKASAYWHPWAICRACGHESRGQR